ncbi:SLAM family member 7 precursor [Salmo salar]|uniref:SLAM family member 7 n=1 Tax=Salmo salar TaxID=8030 RepID=B5XCQ4_SALSA|nr:SLAM family member 7 precursor [Salmo salar]ACI68624.1 SLAM family member 7 precursor [Salmo salar]|eukprot:NP_001134732.1 SLAM family member 7 precursor [Salmo salar]
MSITLLTVFLAEAIICTVSGEQLDRKVGGELLLTPDKSTVPDSITGILWKHGNNKVAEWDKDFDLDIYAAFKERTTLDQTTGELRISGLMKTDSGVYSVEFNSKLLDKTYSLSVIKAVPKPTITSSCNANKTICTLTCEGDTTDAEPVTYSWKVGEGAWEVLDKQLNVSKSETGKSTNSYNYTCELKNSVSGEVSEPVGEVFGSDGRLTNAKLFGISVFVLSSMAIYSKLQSCFSLHSFNYSQMPPSGCTAKSTMDTVVASLCCLNMSSCVRVCVCTHNACM